ncbi:substrate-binding domain-containing protein [Shouchella patagoniensis]|uniref:substrate-binding domain-containing protein n=1 Tax=Shouchella patagoniensis TaxID=228576 RepID=UPI0009959F5E|nr:substrate-binding domain-containing protein [Shouchella patagoniensis]
MAGITMLDVAKKAGVSKSTVSQYLNKRYNYMSGDTKERISSAIKELGYSPNGVARSLRQKKTQTIGVIVANILHAFSTEVIRAIEDTCHKHDVHVIVCNADDDPEKEKRYVEMLRAKQVDGMIVLPTSANAELFNELIEQAYPLVFLDRILADVPVNTVLSDNEKTVRLAVDALVERNYKRIGMILPPISEDITPRLERKVAFEKALTELCLEENGSRVEAVPITGVKQALIEMLTLEQPIDAVIAGNDLVLNEVLRFVNEKEINIPENLALIGIDEVDFAEFLNPPLTTVAQPTFAMGHKAAELLLSEINKGGLKQKAAIYRFEPTLNRRSSF